MRHQLWDLDTGNLIGAYKTEAEALADARAGIAGGVDSKDLGLHADFDEGEDGDPGSLPVPLRGPDLAARAGITASDSRQRVRHSA